MMTCGDNSFTTVQNRRSTSSSSSSSNSSNSNMTRMVPKGSVVVLVVAGIVFNNAGVPSVSGWTTTPTAAAATQRRGTTVVASKRSSFTSSNSNNAFGRCPRQQQARTVRQTEAARSRSSPLLSSSASASASDDDGSISTIDLSFGGTRNETPEQHERVGQELAESIQRWLDSEWFPQDIHLKMGLRAKKSYVECRTADPPQHDVMDILMKISLDLSEEWEEKYDAEAFINPYDVGNYAADWLTKTLTDVEGCECTSELF